MLNTRTKRTLLITIILLFAAVQQAAAGEFLIFYANDVHGETEPCG